MYYPETQHITHDRLGFAVFLAAALHLTLILGLGFEADQARHYSRQLKVTLATRPSSTAPEETQHIAQVDQSGPADDPEYNQPALTRPQPRQKLQQQATDLSRRPQTAPALTTTALANSRVKPEEGYRRSIAEQAPAISPEVERLSQELASLEATLDEQSRAYATIPRVRRLTSVSAKRAVDAAYLHDWRQRVEAVGNRYYPEASRRYGIYGELRLLVIIRHDGSLEDIQVLSSSGFAVLDEAAMKIVRLAAPFAPFPAELRASTDKLEIIRTWQFQENQLRSG